MIEIWKDIEGYEGIYQVSDKGRVKSLPKNHRYGSKHEKILKCGKTIKQRSGEDYPIVCLSKDGIVKEYKIHRLVAQTFIPNPDNKPDVNHKNGIKNDNRVENLEWVTPKENNQHAWDTGLKLVTDKWVKKMKEVNTGRKHSEESKFKIREAKLGSTPWNKGLKTGNLSEEHKQKISLSAKKIKRNRNEKTGLFEKNSTRNFA